MTKKSPSRFARGEKRFAPRPPSPRTRTPPARSSELASAFGRAMAFHRAGRLPEAEEIYRHILSASPDDHESLHLLGVICSQRGDHEQALRLIDAAVNLSPGLVPAYNNRGNVLAELRRLEEALASYDKAIGLDPAYANAHLNRGTTLAQLGRFAEALSSYDRVLVLSPTDAGIWYKRG